MNSDTFNGALRRCGVAAVAATLAVTTIGLPAPTVSAAPVGAPSMSPATDPVPAISVVKQVSVDNGATWHDADNPTGPTVTTGFLGVKFRFQISNVGGTVLENITLTDTDVTIPAASVPTALAVGGVSNWIEVGPFAAQSGQHSNTVTAFATEEGASPAQLPPDGPAPYEYVFVFENGTVAAGVWNGGNNMDISINHPSIVLSDFVHVSCSDSFGFGDGDPTNDGWSSKGQAPDPVDDPNWRLAGYQIRKNNVCGGGDTTTGVTDTDMAHYVGNDVPPSIDIEKDVKVNDGAWFDADDPTGPTAIVDLDEVSFRFTVTNTGGADLTDLDVFEIANTDGPLSFDDAPVASHDPLLIGQSFSFELGPFPAVAGQHMNDVKVTAKTVAPPAFDPLGLHSERNFKYTFRFVLADGTIIEGSSKDNSAEVPASDSETVTRVTPGQTFLQDFHLSCSDDFGFGNDEPDGWGEKGSPEINTTDNGPIVSYQIIKYKSDNPTNSDFTKIDSQCGFGDPSPGPVMVMDTDKAHYVGQVLPAMLGDYVWLDNGAGNLALAGNGIQDPGEPPVEGVVVRLLDGNGNDTGRSTTTDANGFYTFDELVPGQNYRVKFEQPTGTIFTVANQGSDDATDSDAHIETGQTTNVSMAPNEFNQTVDAGLFACPVAAQPGQIIVNLAGTHLFDHGPTMTPAFPVDVPAGTYRVTLVSADFGDRHTVSNQKFEQFFARLTDAAGTTYDSGVISDIPDSDTEPNWLLEQVNTDGNLLVVGTDASILEGVHVAVKIGDQPTANSVKPICVILEPVPVSAIGDFVWLDSDGDGIQDQDETGVDGVTVELLDADMNVIDTTVTANAPGTVAPGYYLFDRLPHGTYFIRFVKPDGSEFTLPNAGDDDVDSDASPVGPDQGKTAAIVLAPGESDLTIDAGLVQPAIEIVKCVRPDPAPAVGSAACGDGNGIDANDANGGDVPVFAPGDTIVWAYLITNTGSRTFDGADVTVTDDVLGTIAGPPAGDVGADNKLSPGETWTYTATGTAADLGNPPAAVPVVSGCADIPADGDPARNVYKNVGSVVVPGASASDPAHYCNPAPSVDIEKSTNGADADGADDADVPVLVPGAQVTWTYTVTNTGVVSIPLADITVSDSDVSVVPVLDPTTDIGADGVLSPGEVWTYTATGVAGDLAVLPTGNAIVQGCTNIPDQGDPARDTYENIGTVTVPGDTDTDDSHYCNPAPSIDIEKATNGIDADGVNDGVPNIAPGADVVWTYVVTNTGVVSIPVGDITVTDSVAGVSPVLDVASDAGADGILSPGEAWTYTASGTALTLNGEDINADHIVSGCANNPLNTSPARNTYENIGTVTIPGDTDTDPSHYCNPPTPGIDIEKLTNGNDADGANDADIPVVAPGADVTWTYLVTNTGTLPYAAADIVVTDSTGVIPVLDATTDAGSDGFLSTGETWTYTATGTAADLGNPPAGVPVVSGCADIPTDGDPTRNVYENIGTVTVPGSGDTDPSHYCNPAPSVDIEKATNGADADGANDADVPVLAPGAQVTWNYTVTNTGVVSIPAGDITVTDSDPTINPVLVVDAASADGVLSPGETWTFTATRAAADLHAPSNGVPASAIVDGCTNIPDQTDPARNTYRNVGTVIVPGDTDSDDSHYCNPLGAIGDRVWLDINANGVQDDGELGIPDVLVRLLDSNMVIIASDETDADGNYLFDQLIQGTYFVQFVAPLNAMLSPQNIEVPPSSDALDSDPDPTTGVTATITLESGETDLTWDAGVFFKASLGDFVWDDRNANGIQDDGEPGIVGVTVMLLDGDGNPTGQTDITDANGEYGFSGLTPGDYIVEFVHPAGYVQSPPDQGGDDTVDSDAALTAVSGRTVSVNLESGEHDPTWDAGYYKLASLGDFVWDDRNANGTQDPDEPGTPGVTVNLLDGDGNPTGQTDITDANGEYGFTGLTPGDYIVEFVPGDLNFTAPGVGDDDTVDSNANPANGQAPVTLESGETDLTIDAGLVAAATLGDRVWDDLDADGIQDDGEPGIPGVTVNLIDANGDQQATTTTDDDGLYTFTNLEPGDYIVEFEIPAGYQQSPADAGGDDAVDSDAGAVGATAPNRTMTINLESGESDLTWDAGLYRPASLGDFVWDDLDADGIQDDGEPGIAGVTVNLLDGDGNPTGQTDITDANGEYGFSGLTPGDYIVEFVHPAGYVQSPPDQGGDDTVDSDAALTAVSGRTISINLESGEHDPTWDAGYYKLASLGDFVWDDRNANGIQDDGEPGIPGVTVTLLDSQMNPISSTTTNASGEYAFTGLQPGTYSVQFDKPAGTNRTLANQGGNDAVDSDADPTTGKTGAIVLTSGENDDTIDAGLTRIPPPDAKADLAIVKTASVETTAPGNTFNWILDVRNNGPDTAVNVRIGDMVPADLTVTGVASSDFTCSNAGNLVSCTRASFASGATGQVVIAVQVKTGVQSGTIKNIGTVQSDTPDPDLTNNSDDDDVDIVVQIPPTTQAPPAPVTLPPTGNSGSTGMVQTAIVMIVLGAGLVLLRRRLTVRPQG